MRFDKRCCTSAQVRHDPARSRRGDGETCSAAEIKPGMEALYGQISTLPDVRPAVTEPRGEISGFGVLNGGREEHTGPVFLRRGIFYKSHQLLLFRLSDCRIDRRRIHVKERVFRVIP